MMIYQSLKHLPYWVSWMIKATVSHKFKKVWVYQTIILPDNNYNVDSIMNYSLTSFLSLFVRQWILDIFGVHNGKDGLQEFISRYPSQKIVGGNIFLFNISIYRIRELMKMDTVLIAIVIPSHLIFFIKSVT